MENFAEFANRMIAAGGAIEVPDVEGLTAQLQYLLNDEAKRMAMGEAAFFAVRDDAVVQRSLALIEKVLPGEKEDRSVSA